MRVTKPAVSAKPKSVAPKAAPKATAVPTPTAPARSRLSAMLGLNPAVVAALTVRPPRHPTCELPPPPPRPGPNDHATGPNGRNDDGGVVGLPGTGDGFA